MIGRSRASMSAIWPSTNGIRGASIFNATRSSRSTRSSCNDREADNTETGLRQQAPLGSHLSVETPWNVVADEQFDNSDLRTPCGLVRPRVRATHRITTPGVSSTPSGTVISSSLPHPLRRVIATDSLRFSKLDQYRM